MRIWLAILALVLLSSCAGVCYEGGETAFQAEPQQGIVFTSKPRLAVFEQPLEPAQEKLEDAEAEASFWRHVAVFLGIAALLAN